MNEFLTKIFIVMFMSVCFMTIIVIAGGGEQPFSPFTGCFGQIYFLDRYVFGSIDDLKHLINNHKFLFVFSEISVVIYGVFFSQAKIVDIRSIIANLKFAKS